MGAQGDAQSKLQEFAEKYSMLNQEHQNLVQVFDNVTQVCYLSKDLYSGNKLYNTTYFLV